MRSNRIPTLALLAALATAPVASAQDVDLCGCAGHPQSLGDFDSSDPNTFPPGTSVSGSSITMPLPEDGVLIFDSFRLGAAPSSGNATLGFARNDRNTPVTLLVAGDLTVVGGALIELSGQGGRTRSQTAFAEGGLGGPGGHRGGNGGAGFLGSPAGGAGFGPVGGAPGDLSTGSLPVGSGGGWTGAADLLPVTGGSGGGGGSAASGSQFCGAGSGGGGGGALFAVANGTLQVDGEIHAFGGFGGVVSLSCGGRPHGGSGGGGSLRLVASAVGGSGRLRATGFVDGRIRLEGFSVTFGSDVDPAPTRVLQPGPVALLVAPSAQIRGIGGVEVPDPPAGWQGAIDVELPIPGTVTVEVETAGVPAGTLVEARVKPHVGGAEIPGDAEIDPANCDGAGSCSAFIDFELDAGSYAIEAEATFLTP